MSEVCDENSSISCECSARDSNTASAVVEQAENLEFVASASAPPLPINEVSADDTSIDQTTIIDSAGFSSPVSVVTQVAASGAAAAASADIASASVVAVSNTAVLEESSLITDVEPSQILEEVKVIDQILEELAPEELNELSFDEIISLKATTPLPEVTKVASKLTTSYDQYKAYLHYIQNGSEEQNNRGHPITTIRKKVPGVCCEPEPPKCVPTQPIAISRRVYPSFYQFLQPQFCQPSCLPKMCAPTLYPQNLMLKNIQPNFQPLGYNFAYSSAFGRGLPTLNQAGAGQFGQAFAAKGFTKPNYMGGFYKF